MFARLLLTLVLSLSMLTPALADQAYVQASAWAVNRLPVMPGQAMHGRCVVQSSFSGNASLQLIVENKKIRGAVFIVTEPIFKKEGRSLDVTVSVNSKAFEFPAQTISKYALAVEISDVYQEAFKVAIKDASMMTLKSGFNAYSFSVSSPADAVEEAVNCTPVAVKSPEPITEPVVVVEAPQQKEAVASLPPIPVAPLAEATKSSGLPIVIGGGGVATQGSQAPEAFLVAEAGDNVPLSDALPKIVPSNYTFRFAQGASAGEKISWGAGQDWLETLVLALDDTDLQVAVNNNVVTVLPSIQSTSMRVAGAPLPTTRDAIIVKEPDLTKPPSPGMMEEARAVLDQLRLEEKDLKVIVGGQVAHDGDDVVAMPSKPDALAQHEKMKPILDEDKVEIDDRPTDKGQDVQVKNIEVYRAEAGEDMADVVARWAKQANIELDMNLQRDYKLARDITVQGDIDLAASQLMAQFKDIPSAPRVGGEGADLVLNNEEVIDNVAPIKETSPVEDRLGVVARWSAAKGTSLHAALVNWARQGQMQLIWDGDRDVQIPENLQSTTRLGNALEMLLSLYDGQTDQPKIQINHDPDTGLIAMIISIEKQ